MLVPGCGAGRIASSGMTAGLFIANNSGWIDPIAKQPSLLAHKWLGQNFDLTNIKSDDCTATRMLPPRHSYLENTIASIGEAFELGADVVELDIHPTTDGQFAIFHDWTLELPHKRQWCHSHALDGRVEED
jgi:glycerophosphoryl diester phosphodiesterase